MQDSDRRQDGMVSDAAIDAALSELVRGEPRRELRRQVMARIAGAAREPRRPRWLVLAPALATVLVAAIALAILLRVPVQGPSSPDTARLTLPTTEPARPGGTVPAAMPSRGSESPSRGTAQRVAPTSAARVSRWLDPAYGRQMRGERVTTLAPDVSDAIPPLAVEHLPPPLPIEIEPVHVTPIVLEDIAIRPIELTPIDLTRPPSREQPKPPEERR
jgi:hypothetical protein